MIEQYISVITTSEGGEVPFPASMVSGRIKAGFLRLNHYSRIPLFRIKNGKLHAAEVVGCVQLGNIRINILPKLDSGDVVQQSRFLLNILHKAGYFRRAYESEGKVAATNYDPMESIIGEFVDAISYALLEGLPRQYQSQSEFLSSIRGKIDFNLLSKSHRCDGLVSVKYSELNKENILTRCIKEVCIKLIYFSKNAVNRKTLSRILTEFDHVDAKLCTLAELERIQLMPTEKHWEKPLQLIKLLIQEKAINPLSAGQVPAFCLIFSMAAVYERALLEILKQVTRRGNTVLKKDHIPTYLLEDEQLRGILQMKPDYRFYISDRLIVVADAKWKRVSESARANGIERSDLYQITAYINRYDVKSAIIFVPLQPWMSNSWSRNYRMVNTKSVLYVVGVDIVSLVSEIKLIREAATEKLEKLISPLLTDDLIH